MGKVICAEVEEGLNLIGLMVALVIALLLMLVCLQPPPRRRYIVSTYPALYVRR